MSDVQIQGSFMGSLLVWIVCHQENSNEKQCGSSAAFAFATV